LSQYSNTIQHVRVPPHCPNLLPLPKLPGPLLRSALLRLLLLPLLLKLGVAAASA
jgi:hypothetical protein